MLAQRRKRFERLLKMRQRELDQKMAELGIAKNHMRSAREALEQAQSALRDAAAHFRVPEGGARSAEEFLEAGAWLQDRVKKVEVALAHQDRAKSKLMQATKATQVAEKAKRQIETLLDRLRAEELAEANRREQIDQDEIAARLARM